MRSRPTADFSLCLTSPWVLCLTSCLLGIASASCGSTCESLAADYEGAIRHRTALVGTGVEPISAGYHHLGMTLSLDFLDRLMGQIDEQLPTISRPLVVEEIATGRRASVRVEASASVDSIEILDPRHDTVRVRFGVNAEATIRRVGSRETHFLLGSVVVDGRLLFELDDNGVPLLHIAMDELAAEGSQIAVHALPQEIGQAIRGFVEPGIADQILDGLEQITLMRFPPIALPSLAIELAPIDLVLSDAEQTVFLGFVTNLRPSTARELRTKGELPNDGFRLTIHPDLIAAATRLALENGTLPNRFDPGAQPNAEGPIHVTFERFDLSSQRVELDFGLWSIGDDDCWHASLSTSGLAHLQENTVSIVLTDIDAGSLTGDASYAGDWLRSDFVSSVVTLAEAIVGIEQIEVGTGDAMLLRPVALSISTQVIEVDLIPQ